MDVSIVTEIFLLILILYFEYKLILYFEYKLPHGYYLLIIL